MWKQPKVKLWSLYTRTHTKFKPNFLCLCFWSASEYYLQLHACAAYLWALQTHGSSGLRLPVLLSPPVPDGRLSVQWNGSKSMNRRTGEAGLMRRTHLRMGSHVAQSLCTPRLQSQMPGGHKHCHQTSCVYLQVVINRIPRLNCTPNCLWSRAKAYSPKHISFMFGCLFYNLSWSSLTMSTAETKQHCDQQQNAHLEF